jgi:hypothetical protein
MGHPIPVPSPQLGASAEGHNPKIQKPGKQARCEKKLIVDRRHPRLRFSCGTARVLRRARLACRGEVASAVLHFRFIIVCYCCRGIKQNLAQSERRLLTAVGMRAGAAVAQNKKPSNSPSLFTLVSAMNRNAAGVLLLAVFLVHIAAYAESVKDALNSASASTQEAENALKEFEGKVLIFRHSLHDDSQRYDADGKVLKGGAEESWTTNGVVLIDHIELTPAKLSIAADEYLFFSERKGLSSLSSNG